MVEMLHTAKVTDVVTRCYVPETLCEHLKILVHGFNNLSPFLRRLKTRKFTLQFRLRQSAKPQRTLEEDIIPRVSRVKEL